MNKLVHVGFNNFVNSHKVVTVMEPGSAPAKRIIKKAKDSMMLTDSTSGNKTLAVIIMDTEHVVTAGVKPETIMKRMNEL